MVCENMNEQYRVNPLCVSLCQMNVGDDKVQNVQRTLEYITESKKLGAKLAVLPEMFCCPYDNSKFQAYCEPEEKGYALSSIRECAAKNEIAVAAGTLPEVSMGKIYNTQYLVDEKGDIVGKHRKMHLFDIDIRNGISFHESDVLSPGDKVTMTELFGIKTGLAVCYDIRFPEYFRVLSQDDTALVILPAAFNMTTGPAHWETVLKCRALDNQMFIIAVSPARDRNSSYIAYGHSMITGPWGDVLIQADEKPCIKTLEIDFSMRDQIMLQLPLLKHKRSDLYKTVLL